MAYGIRICSFIDAEGSAQVGSTFWRWEFHEYMGPTFYRGKKSEKPVSPSEKSPVWDHFNAWLLEHFTAKNNKRALEAMSQWYEPGKGRKPLTVKASTP